MHLILHFSVASDANKNSVFRHADCNPPRSSLCMHCSDPGVLTCMQMASGERQKRHANLRVPGDRVRSDFSAPQHASNTFHYTHSHRVPAAPTQNRTTGGTRPLRPAVRQDCRNASDAGRRFCRSVIYLCAHVERKGFISHNGSRQALIIQRLECHCTELNDWTIK